MNRLENIVTLTDSDGGEIDYEILDVLPYEGEEYAVLLPLDDESDPPQVTVLRVLHAEGEAEDADDQLQGLDDEALLQAVFEAFQERNADLFSFEE